MVSLRSDLLNWWLSINLKFAFQMARQPAHAPVPEGMGMKRNGMDLNYIHPPVSKYNAGLIVIRLIMSPYVFD